MTTMLELQTYYAKLLIMQYVGKPRAFATIKTQVTPLLMPQVSKQTISFTTAPASGVFVLSYDGVSSASINWNDSASTIQTKLRAITGLGSITVEGEIADLSFVVTFVGVEPPAELLVLVSSTIDSGDPAIDETDVSLPLAVQDGFNITGDNVAVGDQLDVIGQYVGVERSGQGLTQVITLNDADFLTLIKLGIARNSLGSSLSEIQDILNFFFPNQILVFDYRNMVMSYMLSTSIGSSDLVELFIAQGLLPRPMAVQISVVVYAPTINNFFGFVSYQLPIAVNNKPFNTYEDYDMDAPWLTYQDTIIVGA